MVTVHADADHEIASRSWWDCDDMACDFCNLGPWPGETQGDWLARLRAQLRGTSRPSRCGSCGSVKWEGEWCRSCHPYKPGTEICAAGNLGRLATG